MTSLAAAGASLLPTSINSNLKKLKKTVGKSLLNLHSLLTSGPQIPTTPVTRREPFKPFQPSTPSRPPRRRSSESRRGKDEIGEKFIQQDVIPEVITPTASPIFMPKVPMPGTSPQPSSSLVRKPSVPMPGQPRIPSPTLTVNSLDLIGTPGVSR